MRIQAIGKSLLIAFAGAGVASFFLMMAAIAVLALWERLSGNVAQKSVVVSPTVFMRTYGLPIAIAMFVVLFLFSMIRFRRIEADSMIHH